jgi:Trk K+ transport system NAD-binding subunit
MKVTFRKRFNYWFDNFMSKGTGALIAGLFVVSVIVILIAAVVISVFNINAPEAESMGFLEAFWQSLMRTLDAGTMGGDEGWPFRMVMFFVTLGGIFVLSALIGVLNSGLESKLESLRKGRSMVIESGHTVILGWSNKVFTIISELAEANANQKNPCVVILGDKDKVEMEEAVKEYVTDSKNTKVVCRSGKPVYINNLKMVNLDDAKSIIVLAPDKEDPDADVIKTVLAITNNAKRKKGKYHIVAEINDQKNAGVCKMVGKDEIEVVLSSEIISKITAQTCRQSGLSLVYLDMLVYEGDELYFQSQPELTGKSYGEALFAYNDSSLFGIQKSDGTTLINPPMDTVIEKGDEVLCISEDDDTIKLNGEEFIVNEAAVSREVSEERKTEKTLMLGWNKRGAIIAGELDSYVSPGSEITIIADIEGIETLVREDLEGLKNNQLQVIKEDTTSRSLLEKIGLEGFDHIIILSYSGRMTPEEADSVTLITLLHLRDISEKKSIHLSVVSEILVDENRALAEVTNADDFIVSEKLVSLLLTQISEKKELSNVYTDIFNPDGSEIYLKPVTNYVKPGIEVDFYTVVEAARRRNETAFGYRLLKNKRNAAEKYGVKINPRKSDRITFTEEDRIIVLAED